LKHFLIIISSFLFLQSGYSQTLEQTYALAIERFENEQYDFAANYYQRVLFFDSEKKYSDSYLFLADCFFKKNDFVKAAEYYDVAYNIIQNDSLKKEIVFRKASCFLIQHNYDQAIEELFKLPDSLSTTFKQKKYFYSGVSYFGMEEYDKSEIYFSSCIDASDEKAQTQLKEQFVKVRKIHHLNPKVAKILSVILPGAGQFYSGDIKNGLNSLLLNSAFVILFVVTAQNYSLFDAFISVFPWFERYYLGGVQHAGEIALEKEKLKKQVVYQRIIDIIAD
jgi:tetratricopeptide (TPR) repeat protein